jgi:DHA3 family macrolide efflux protein-like MFS transporter
MVPAEELDRCAGRTQAFQSASTLASPALAAHLYSLMPLNFLIGLDVLGAAAGILAVMLAHIPYIPREKSVEKIHVLRDTLEGLKYLHRQRGLFALTMVAALLSFAYVPAAGLYPLMVLNRFGGTTAHAGLIETGFSVGMLLGGIILSALRGPMRRIYLMAVSLTVIGLAITIMGLLPPDGLIAFGVLTLLSGFAAPFFQGLFMALLQRRMHPDYMGRAMGVSASLMSLACPLGLAVAGTVAETWGAPVWFIAGGIICVLCAVLCVLIPAVRSADDD